MNVFQNKQVCKICEKLVWRQNTLSKYSMKKVLKKLNICFVSIKELVYMNQSCCNRKRIYSLHMLEWFDNIIQDLKVITIMAY